MTFTGYQLAETPSARLLIGSQGSTGSQFWVQKLAISDEQIGELSFGRKQPITCTIADWWWQREEARRAQNLQNHNRQNDSARHDSAAPRKRKPKLKQAELI